MPSSVKLGSRPTRSRMRWYSSSFSPCAATSSGVIGTELEMVMGGDFCPWERDFESSSYRKLCDRYTHRSRKKHAKQPKNGSEETVGERYGIPAVTAPTNQEIFYMATRQ